MSDFIEITMKLLESFMTFRLITRRTRSLGPEIGGTVAPACSSRDAQISA